MRHNMRWAALIGGGLLLLYAFRRREMAPQERETAFDVVQETSEESPFDVVQEASEESFPASDAPGWR